MQPYQEEYLYNLREIRALSRQPEGAGLDFAQYAALLEQRRSRAEVLLQRNTVLLRHHLFPLLDGLFQAEAEETKELSDFAARLLRPGDELDAGLFCQIHRALLSCARQRKDRNAVIRELYWLGFGRNSLYGKTVGLPLELTEKYIHRMRLCFVEAAAYLKYFEDIGDAETQGYIIRSRANISLGAFKSPGEKIGLIRKTMEILQDEEYQKKAPELPWERYRALTHQQMAASVSYGRNHEMTAEDVAAVMESCYLVYQARIQQAEAQSQRPSTRWAMPYYTTEFYCGLLQLDQLLTRVEELMDQADPEDFSVEGAYGVISLPAFYCQYLRNYPERLPPRESYLDSLYRRILDYVERLPQTAENESVFLYLCQLSHTFVEVEGGLTYRAFLQRLLIRFAPRIFIHSCRVAAAAGRFCRMILEEEPDFFDDLPAFQALAGEEKREAVVAFAHGCGLFHDVGEINFMELFSRAGRQWLAEEEELARLHTHAGETLLLPHPSTRAFAPAALGHHAWYDGSRGYPPSYRRLDCPARQMVDLIGLVDWLETVTSPDSAHTGEYLSFEQAVQAAVEREGKQFSPLLTAWLREGGGEPIRQGLEQGQRDACLRLYQDARRESPPLPAS